MQKSVEDRENRQHALCNQFFNLDDKTLCSFISCCHVEQLDAIVVMLFLTVETTAETKTVNWLKTQNCTQACILSDSMNLLRRNSSWPVKAAVAEILADVTDSQTNLYLCDRTCRCVKRNKGTDQLANSVIIEEAQSVDRADVMNG